ncbi:MAG: autotransporter outer membrane beta-barrel domain-containing protein [Burkholderiales bacterium]|nr:autotransporter outer membrane beta-barrel domain-containing protein [Burkholderiales bacterium]
MRLSRIATACAVAATPCLLPSAALANGCIAQYSSQYLCAVGDNSKGTARNTISTPGLNSLSLIGQVGGGAARSPFAAALGQRYALGDNEPQTGLAAATGASRWSIWGALGENHLAYSFQPARSEGRSTLTLGGVDYTFANNVVLGVAATMDRTRTVFQANINSPLSSNGYSIAPYISVPLSRNWLLDASVGLGDSKIKVTDYNAPGEGNTKSDRTYFSAGVSYAARTGSWNLTGKANYLQSEDKIASFTMTDRTFVPASNIRVSQMRLGVQAAYNAGIFVPFAGLTYIRDLQSPNQAALAGQNPANDKDSFLVALGVNVYSRGMVSGGILYTTETARSQVKNDVFMANIALRF